MIVYDVFHLNTSSILAGHVTCVRHSSLQAMSVAITGARTPYDQRLVLAPRREIPFIERPRDPVERFFARTRNLQKYGIPELKFGNREDIVNTTDSQGNFVIQCQVCGGKSGTALVIVHRANCALRATIAGAIRNDPDLIGNLNMADRDANAYN